MQSWCNVTLFYFNPCFCQKFSQHLESYPTCSEKISLITKMNGAHFLILSHGTRSIVNNAPGYIWLIYIARAFQRCLFRSRFPVSQTASHLNRHTLPSHHTGGTVSIYNPALLSPYLLSRSQGHIGSKEVVFKLPNNYSFIRAAAKPALHRSTEETAIISLDQSPK